jgi:hypothetical protein
MKKKQGKQNRTKRDQKSGFQETRSATGEDDKKPFDFGGLPRRDLKKNLGCG